MTRAFHPNRNHASRAVGAFGNVLARRSGPEEIRPDEECPVRAHGRIVGEETVLFHVGRMKQRRIGQALVIFQRWQS